MNAPEDLVVDGRGLTPPEPMERVMAALDTLQPGQRVSGFSSIASPIPYTIC